MTNTGIESIQLPQLDDGISEQIDITAGLPFGTSHPIAVWVCLVMFLLNKLRHFLSHSLLQIANNGIFSFNEVYAHWSPEPFPGISSSVENGYLITPFWDDVDISGVDGGSIYYQVHTASNNNPPSMELLNQVNTFIQTVENVNFTGVWMLVAMWDEVHPYPHGISPDLSLYPDVNEVYSYTYKLTQCIVFSTNIYILTDHIISFI